MMHPATAPTLPCPARWPATPPTMAPLMHPFASAAAGANAMPRIAVQRINGFMLGLRKLATARHRYAEQERNKQTRERCFAGDGADGRERLTRLPRGRDGVA